MSRGTQRDRNRGRGRRGSIRTASSWRPRAAATTPPSSSSTSATAAAIAGYVQRMVQGPRARGGHHAGGLHVGPAADARHRPPDRLQAVGLRDRPQRLHRPVPPLPARARRSPTTGRRALGGADHLRLVTRDAVARRRRRRQAAARPPVRRVRRPVARRHHQILVLRELEGLSYREIGERLGMSRPAVESTLFRARRRLTEEYDELVTRSALRARAVDHRRRRRGDARRRATGAAWRATSPTASRAGATRACSASTLPRAPRSPPRSARCLPLPFLRRRGLGGTESAAPAGGQASGALAQWTASAGVVAEPLTNWAKAAVTVAAVAIAGDRRRRDGAARRALAPALGRRRARHAPARHAPAAGRRRVRAPRRSCRARLTTAPGRPRALPAAHGAAGGARRRARPAAAAPPVTA